MRYCFFIIPLCLFIANIMWSCCFNLMQHLPGCCWSVTREVPLPFLFSCPVIQFFVFKVLHGLASCYFADLCIISHVRKHVKLPLASLFVPSIIGVLWIPCLVTRSSTSIEFTAISFVGCFSSLYLLCKELNAYLFKLNHAFEVNS